MTLKTTPAVAVGIASEALTSWDKVGLDHFGGLLPAGGHTVLYLFGNHGTITAAEWPNFLDEQQKLIAKSKAARRNEAHKR
jgi:hypothetical protein